MRGHGQERATKHASPEGIALGEVQGEVEGLELVRRAGSVEDRRPAARDVMPERDQRHHGARDVNAHLHNVGPDHSSKPTLEGVEQR